MTAPDTPERTARPRTGESDSRLRLAQTTAIIMMVVIALIALAAAVWQLLGVILLAFAAVLIATIFHGIADPIAARTPLSRVAALPIAVLILLGVIFGLGWLVQAKVASEVMSVLEKASNVLPQIGQYIGGPELSTQATDALKKMATSGSLWGQVTWFGATALGFVTNLLLILFGGVYLAINPGLYRNGLLKMLPTSAQDAVGETMDATGRALKAWLVGQLIAMLVTGIMTWVGLWLIGIPSAAGLALIAGLFEFIPLLGPFLGAVPALLIAFSEGQSMLLWTAGIFLVVQQIESNLIQPVISRHSVSIAPALLLFAVVAFGIIFGTLGIFLAAPLTVAVYVAVAKLYVMRTLGHDAEIPGEP